MNNDYMTTEELAKFIGVSKSLVEKWRRKGWLLPDVIGHDKRGRAKTYYYSKEHVLQLASVYVNKNSENLSDKFNPVHIAYTSDYSTNESEDKKNYASEGAEKSEANTITIADEKQSRIADLAHFLNQLYGKITAPHFAYLWTKQRGIFPFVINDETQRAAMARKAIELSKCGVDVWHSVNPVCIQPNEGKRGDETVVSYQIACVVDIDIRSVAHKGDPSKLVADFDEAKSFLPFTPSLIIFSGYGLHAYYIFDTPIEITDDNRENLKYRNNLLLNVTRACW